MKNSPFASDVKIGKVASLTILYLFFIAALIINFTPFMDSQDALMDFGSFYAAGLKAQNGENPYDPNSEYIFDINFSRVGAGGKMMNLNPPISVVIFRALSYFDPHRSLIIWQIVSAVLYASVVIMLGWYYKQNIAPTKIIWAFTLAGFWHTIVLGQIYSLLLLFTALGWLFLQRGKYVPAGIVIGLVVAIKPNFVIWPIFLLASGYYITFLAAAVSGLIISAIPIIFYGTNIYSQWLEASSLRLETLIMPGNNSIVGLTARFQNMNIGILLSVIAVAALLILSKSKTPNTPGSSERISALGILASLLASPISWTGYTILLLPIFFSLKKWTFPVMISAALLSIPFVIVLQFFQTSFVNFVLFGWLYGWAILLLLGSLLGLSRQKNHDDEDHPDELIHLKQEAVS
ncbi:MAG: DUF2029 domain-containing protein [Chloroflexota bacterium]|nr:DUF2029 domain-containing protein [Chloroflexota bacterium]